MRKIALITGSSRGIGAATAELLASKDYDICINYKNNNKAADDILSKIMHKNINAIAVQADVSLENDVLRLFQEIDNRLGKLTALVNNAGILLQQSKLEDLTADRINTLFTTNVTSAFLCCREAIKRMSINHGGTGGAIVNVSSVAARIGSPNEFIDYAATKGAIDTLTIGLAAEVAGENIRVNGVRPGLINTEMQADTGEPDRVKRMSPNIPLKRGGEAREVAAGIAWLLSEEASYVTGNIMDISGGR